MSCSTNIVCEIWNDDTGEKITVGPDADGLDMVEIRSYTDDGKIAQRVTMTQEQAGLVSRGIDRFLAGFNCEKD